MFVFEAKNSIFGEYHYLFKNLISIVDKFRI